MSKKSNVPRKVTLPGLDGGKDLHLLKGKTYKIITGGRSVFGSLRKKISNTSVLIVGFDQKMRTVQVFLESIILRIDRKRGKHSKK